MNPILIRPAAILTMDRTRRVIRGGGVIVEGGKIARVLEAAELQGLGAFAGDRVNAPGLTLVPGFVQTHVHLCQTLFRGLADDLDLLDWLVLKIFPFEAAHNSSSMYASAMLGIAELIASGTTTIMDMGSIHHEEQVVRAVEETGLRACVGKTLMDTNPAYPRLSEPSDAAIRSALEQARQWHGSAEGRIRYAVAPRFVLSCTEDLLRNAWEMTEDFDGMVFHTHAAENSREMQAVRKRFGMDNVEYFESIGVLHANTCLAHCVWLNDRELDLMHERRAHVLHCPSSNLKLGSGVARVPEMLRRGISVSLGADGAPCNNSLDMFREMRHAALVQKAAHGPSVMRAQDVLGLATINGAAALGLEKEIGSIEGGKQADLVMLDLSTVGMPCSTETAEQIASAIVYSASPVNVDSVMVAGRWLFRKREFVFLDRASLPEAGREEIRKLLNRVEPS
jgi:cytosine/adenosine deaminase-related metal-dependent hydrolase